MEEVRSEIRKKAEAFVERYFREHFSTEQLFHNFPHALHVRSAALKIAEKAGLDEEEQEILALAGLFHDLGYHDGTEGHEEKSAQLAREFLEQEEYPEEKIVQVENCILATLPSRAPESFLEKVMKDADLSHLGSEEYFAALNRLKEEWEHMSGIGYKNSGWWIMNEEFIRNHQFFTEEAQELYGQQKKRNLKTLNAVAEVYKKPGKEKKKKDKEERQGADPIMHSKPAQMMFKTALRNHIDLTNIADNKANIMLSINAIIVTITIPLVANFFSQNTRLIVPVGLLLLTCVTSIVFAALVTRPIKMTGHTQPDTIFKGHSNLFFFGNFYRMPLDEYLDGMRSVLNNEQHLNQAIIRDLYFLGKALGNKYRLLRICYMVFIIGMVLTVFSFGIMEWAL